MKGRNSERKRQLIVRYYAVHILHTWAMTTFRTIVAGYLIIGEVLVILSIFIVIRLKMRLGVVSFIALVAGGVSYFCTKIALQFSADLTDRSKEFSKPFGRLLSLSKGDKCPEALCKPLKLVIGSTFTVTKQSILTISQDIILMNLINLLVTYKWSLK